MADELDDDKVEFDPGEISEFGKRMLEAADYWWAENCAPYKLANDGDDVRPDLGEYAEAKDFEKANHDKVQQMTNAFKQLYGLLEGLAEGADSVAEQYQSLEELNEADADALDSLVDPGIQESMQDVSGDDVPDPADPVEQDQGNEPGGGGGRHAMPY